MALILTVTAVCLLLGYGIWQYTLCPSLKKSGKGDKNALYIIGIMVIAFVVHMIAAAKYHGHKTDMNCFSAWANQIFTNGIGQFYTSESFHDYPPGYMYILYVIGALRKVFEPTGAGLNVLVKMPAMICDMLTGWLIYKIADKKLGNARAALISGLYLFNPAVIMNSAVWGQVDSVYTLFVAVMIYLIAQKQMIKSYFAFALCIFIKPQAFIFTPVLIFGIIENVFLPKFDKDKFVKNLIWGLGAIALLFVLALPFGITNVIEQYKLTLESYPYMTVNGFNVWGALGKNWEALTPLSTVLGYLFIVLIVAYSAYLFFKSKSGAKYYFTAAFLSLATYMLSTKMHDRYYFPTMLMLLLAVIETKDAKTYTLYILNSAAQFFNVAWVLFIYEQDINKYFKSPVIIWASIVNIIIFAYFMYVSHKSYAANRIETVLPPEPIAVKKGKKNQPQKNKTDEQPKTKRELFRTQVLAKITKTDVIAMLIITLIYSGIALYDLGDMAAPETEVAVAGNELVVDLGEEKVISELKFFNGSYHLNDKNVLDIEFKDSDGQIIKKESYNSGAVFYWTEKKVNISARYILLSADKSENLNLKELCLLDENKNIITPVNIQDESVSALFDEQELCPERSNFRNGTYFDEIYHARTAYEFIHKLSIYEWTHPPLGKLIMALGILIFGMNPFGWRIAGTFVGILMIPVIYIFSKKLLKHSWMAIAVCLLFTFDFMHFAQTRIATIDVYVTFFIMLMYLFMFKYYTMSFYDTPFKKTLVPLALSGICMGLGVASKWTGAYAGAGLAVVFFYTILERYNEYRCAVKNRLGESNGIPNVQIIEEFKPKLIKTLCWCVLFFVIVPIIIYCCAYIPYMQTPSGDGLKTVITNMNSMYTYHAKTVLNSTHSFASKWYEWPIIKRPIWFYSGSVSDEIKEGISSFGNPAVWWTGIAAFAYMVYIAIKKRDRNALFLVIAYLAQLVPWMGVERLMFIYHYFPCVPFIALMIGYSIYDIYESAKNKKKVIIAAIVLVVIAIALFALFYPVLSGQPCDQEFAKNWLKWFDSWVLLSTK